MGELALHRAERADALADALARLLVVPLPDPFATEVVAVPAKGIERWLAQRLSHQLGVGDGASSGGGAGDGVCAGIAFPSPSAVVAAAIDAATGVDPELDPWRPERALWPLLEVIDACAAQPWCAPLAAHLAARPGRRYTVAHKLAQLFGTYAAHRPEMVRAWQAGAEPEGVAADLAWQAQLWRRLAERIGVPGPAERLAGACAALRREPALAALPPRLSVFGPTRLTAQELAVFAALGEHREVHLWLPHPSPALWANLPALSAVPRRRVDPTAVVPRHPLLSSQGRDVRELQVRLAATAGPYTEHHHALPDPPATLLGRLQRELRDDAPPALPRAIEAGDRSVTVHACHGPDRQVEVLREIVLGLLAADPTLEPRDIVVMCPDIETFAPLVSATFGLGAEHAASHPGHQLQVRLADRALRQVNPLLDVVARLLELAGARQTASELLDLLAAQPVRRRFALDDDDLEKLRGLALRSGVRWGLDAEHRAPFRLEGFGQNTWEAGLDRMLLGVAMPGGPREWLGTALPLEEVESADTERLGALAEFVERIGGVLAALTGERPLQEWVATLVEGLDLLTATSSAEAWQADQARTELAEAALAAGPHAATVALGLADVAGLLGERLRGGPTRASFRTGTLTVATLVPMRSVPHRVVCLLGVDDGVFPRAGIVDGDDVLARDPLVGERDARSEDRQLLLDAVCAATERLVIVHSGADERTGARRPPAVPVGELLDAIVATAGPEVLARIVVRHPLQPFDSRNFAAGALGAPGPFSFDAAALAGARAAAGERPGPPPFLPAPLPLVRADPISLDELIAFVEHPVKAFLGQRVGISTFGGEEEPTDALPVEPDGLARWAIGNRILLDRVAGIDLDRAGRAEWRRGELPPGALGDRVLTSVLDDVEPLVALAATVRRGAAADDRDVEAALPDGRRVVGTISGLHGQRLVRVEYSRLAPKHRLRAWVQLLALTVATGEPWAAVTLGRGSYQGLQMATAGPLDVEAARSALADLVAVAEEGRCAPLPLPTVAGHAYAKVRRNGASAEDAFAEAARAWGSGAGAERADRAYVRVWGEAAEASAVFAEAAPYPETDTEPSRFGSLAMRLWAPLLQAEELVRR